MEAAPDFVKALCGYRNSGKPNTSDAHDKGSITWGEALFRQLDVKPGKGEPKGAIGTLLEDALVKQLVSCRNDLTIKTRQSVALFQQYRHLGVFPEFSMTTRGGYERIGGRFNSIIEAVAASEQREALKETRKALKETRKALEKSRDSWLKNDELVNRLRNAMPDESVLKLDITVSPPPPEEGDPTPRLLAALSSKWTLRTDRGQDPITHGNKMSALRRGPMPHYALVTLEPRSAMLALVAEGSGAVDCVYHLALDELIQAGRVLVKHDPRQKRKPYERLIRLVEQGRIRAWSDLLAEIRYLPGAEAPKWEHDVPSEP